MQPISGKFIDKEKFAIMENKQKTQNIFSIVQLKRMTITRYRVMTPYRLNVSSISIEVPAPTRSSINKIEFPARLQESSKSKIDYITDHLNFGSFDFLYLTFLPEQVKMF